MHFKPHARPSRPQPSLITPHPNVDPPLATASTAAAVPAGPVPGRWRPQPTGYRITEDHLWDTRDIWNKEVRILRGRGHDPNHGVGRE